MTNIQKIAFCYVAGAVVMFVVILLFFWWICRLEDKERELYRYQDHTDEKIGVCSYILIAIPLALLWCIIPPVLIVMSIYYEAKERFLKFRKTEKEGAGSTETEEKG